MLQTEEQITIRLSRKKMASIVRNSEKSASIVNLTYISDKQEGILRVRDGNNFTYTFNGKKVADPERLSRVRGLVIPPAWENVWICSSQDGHIQATGVDVNGRKQYRYHPLWNALRSETKFFQLYDFGTALISMRKRISEDLALSGLPQRKVLAAIVSLMQFTGMRIGSNIYEKLYGSFGLSTMKDKHVKINGNEMRFYFKGKKGIYHDITLRSKRLAKIVKQCREIPGKELFQYYDDNHERRTIDSGLVNNYIREISGGNFTSKDFRTWTGSLSALKAFLELGYADSETAMKRRINEAIDMAASQLGNTRNVCRKYYIHPVVIKHYMENDIEKYFAVLQEPVDENGLLVEEQILMNMLHETTKYELQTR